MIPSINFERLKADVLALGEIGVHSEDRGIYRMAFTDADMAGKRWLKSRIEEAGAEARIDGAGNVIGRLGGVDDEAPAVIMGSHTDTVPRAGMLDGSLGVLCGLECLRTLSEAKVKLKQPVELISFSDEEGRFGGMLGSQSFAGMITPETVFATDLDGVVLRDAMQAQGFEPMAALDARRVPESVAAYFELHIEQGPVLDRKGESVGIVEDITGLVKWLVRFRGEANHAGTTPMEMRRDAFMGLADFAHEFPRILDENGGEHSRATVGSVQIIPGAPNTVPGEVVFSLDVRDTDPGRLVELTDAMRKALSAIARRRGLMMDFDVQSEISPVACDARLIELIETQAKDLGLKYRRMPSGAAHDAQILASIAPVAMIFVPSKEGISHSPAEWTDWADIESGANLLLRSVLAVSNSSGIALLDPQCATL